MARWYGSGSAGREAGTEKPFSKLVAKHDYYYFDLNYIVRNIDRVKSTCDEARKMAAGGAVKLTNVRLLYDTEALSAGQILCAAGTFTERGREYGITMYLSKDTVSAVECERSGCYYVNSGFYGNVNEMCEHAWALAFLLEDYIIRYNPGDATQAKTEQMLGRYRHSRVNAARAGYSDEQKILRIEPRLERTDEMISVSFKTGTDRLYVVKNLTDFVSQVDNGEKARFGKSTVIDYANCRPDGESQKYFDFIREAVNEELDRKRQMLMHRSRMRGQTGAVPDTEIRGAIPMTGPRMDRFYDLICGRQIEYSDRRELKGGSSSKDMISCRAGIPQVELTVAANEDRRGNFDGVTVTGVLPDMIEGVQGCYSISGDGYLERAGMDEMRDLLPVFHVAGRDGIVTFNVGRKRLSEFYYSVLPLLRECAAVKEPDEKEIAKYLAPEAEFKFYLDAADDNIGCQVRVNYGNKYVQITDVFDEDKWKSCESWRDMNREEETAAAVLNYFPAVDFKEQMFHCNRDENAIYKVLSQGVDDLLTLGEVNCTDRFKRLRIRPVPKVTVGVSVDSSVMDLSISSDDLSREELLEALNSYRLKKKYFRLKNGDFVKIDDRSIEALSDMMDSMHVTPREFVSGKMHLPAYRALYLDKMLEEGSGIYAKRDRHFKKLVKEFKTVDDSDFEVPEDLSETLRGYQVTGYKWMRTLAEYGFGGILADDMGLGKTVQMIAAFVAWKEEALKVDGKEAGGKKDLPDAQQGGKAESAEAEPGGSAEKAGTELDGRREAARTGAGTNLVVCPASLVYNWQEELTKFAPELSVGIVAGTQAERAQTIGEYSRYDVLVTSYDALKRDIDKYEDCSFQSEVLDEAQFIKNHTTAAAKSVKLIHSRYRFALTGTPIENRLSEFWSIFDFLMPGFLYEYSNFKKEFETPIVKNKDEDASERLRRMVSPFIMRRLKKDVLRDLPDKIEKVWYAKLDTAQQRLYDGQVAHMQKMLMSQNDENFAKDRIKVLAELTKIRQICCDPSLIFEDYSGGSAKREACMELVHQAIEGEHRMLIFSQFTSMLALLEDDLNADGIKYYKITGETPKQQRLEMVHAFNADDTPVFLISLKAGGTGLNLVGADIVIHYDPWWNTAVQNQATDRAHRIGQTQVVSVYRLIVKDSIEEKILKMQEDKKNLADEILTGENGGLGSMSREELMELLGV